MKILGTTIVLLLKHDTGVIKMSEIVQHSKKVAVVDFRDFFYPFVAVYRMFVLGKHPQDLKQGM